MDFRSVVVGAVCGMCSGEGVLGVWGCGHDAKCSERSQAPEGVYEVFSPGVVEIEGCRFPLPNGSRVLPRCTSTVKQGIQSYSIVAALQIVKSRVSKSSANLKHASVFSIQEITERGMERVRSFETYV